MTVRLLELNDGLLQTRRCETLIRHRQPNNVRITRTRIHLLAVILAVRLRRGLRPQPQPEPGAIGFQNLRAGVTLIRSEPSAQPGRHQCFAGLRTLDRAKALVVKAHGHPCCVVLPTLNLATTVVLRT